VGVLSKQVFFHTAGNS